ncbi:MAG: sensor domain-containing diguanylate cyclase [Gemmatimonadales bacterium]|nr:sensor domain-containing diguanylate cyclase [Gemmatimonadales bacterium]
MLIDGALTRGMRHIAVWWSALTVLAIGTAVLSLALEWSGVPVRAGALTYDVTVYPPLFITILLAVWLGPGWGAIPAFLAAVFLARYSGLSWATSGLFALGGPVQVLVLWGAMVTLNVHPDLPKAADIARFLLAGLVALSASSLAVFVWNSAHHLDLATGQRFWRGWMIGGFLQIGLIVVPVLRWLGRPTRLWFDRQFHNPPRHDLDYTHSVQMVVAVAFMMVALVAHGVALVVRDIPRATLTLEGQPLLPRLSEIGLFLALLLITVLATTSVFASALAQLSERERGVSLRDGLTGCYNRRAFYDMFPREADRSRRLSRGISVIGLDVDEFKAINDQHGHETGDEVLRHVTRRIQVASREEDLIFRWGGEEFVLLLPHTNPENAGMVAERVRSQISAEPLIISGTHSPISLTVSLGVAGTREYPVQPDALILRADAACYLAKQRGRNQVVHDPEGEVSAGDAPSDPSLTPGPGEHDAI